VAELINGFQVAAGLLFVAVGAVTGLAEERTRGTLEVLLTTPLPSSRIVWAKWWAAFRVVPLLAVLPSLVAAFSHSRGDVPASLRGVLVFGLVVAYGAALTSLGLFLATRLSRSGWAIALTVGLYVGFTAGWVAFVMNLFGPEPLGIPLIMASPFAGVIFVVEGRGAAPACAIGWMVVYGLLAFVLLVATLASFDRCLGRVSPSWVRPLRARPRRPAPAGGRRPAPVEAERP
jgi:ABC-type transport system involved in multi-copper enzyme maturation permease subunit